jgi:ABC-type polysaccharide/polyol phosphate transport system ATPase subunit
MSSDVILRVDNVSKRYEIYDAPHHRLFQTLFHGRKQFYKEFWALRDVSFEVKRGECIGIIGRNGSGKSTLLQIIAGTLAPTVGKIEVNGRVSALLELGSGFNPEFTGRENVYMNGAILGLSKAQMDKKFDEIAAFADIGEFIEQPVKIYSSGMMVRLAFAVHTQIRPEIFLVDEALAVGDMFFQSKCYAFIRKLVSQGTSVVFVSHSQSTVESICQRGILLEFGRKFIDSNIPDVFAAYFKIMNSCQQQQIGTSTIASNLTFLKTSKFLPSFEKRYIERAGNGKMRYIDCFFVQNEEEICSPNHGERCFLRAVMKVMDNLDDPAEIGMVINTLEGPRMVAGDIYTVDFCFDFKFAPGKYRIDLGARVPIHGEYADKVIGALVFEANKGERDVPLLLYVESQITFTKLEQ